MLYIDIHTHNKQQVEGSLAVVNLFPENTLDNGRLLSIGLHPWYIDAQTLDCQITNIEKKARNSNVIAIGEIGLDRMRGEELANQQDVFLRQVAIALDLGKPIIIHCVRAFSELLYLKKKYIADQVKCVVHGFRGKKELADQLIKAGMYLSFGAQLILNLGVQKTFSELPLHKVFFETDEADVDIREIYAIAAKIKGYTIEQLGEEICDNFNTVFDVGFE